MSASKSPLSIALAMSLIAGTALLAGCAQPASTTTSSEQVSSAPASVDTSSSATYRRQ
jgi:uncharacterized lipoprotein YajG